MVLNELELALLALAPPYHEVVASPKDGSTNGPSPLKRAHFIITIFSEKLCCGVLSRIIYIPEAFFVASHT